MFKVKNGNGVVYNVYATVVSENGICKGEVMFVIAGKYGFDTVLASHCTPYKKPSLFSRLFKRGN